MATVLGLVSPFGTGLVARALIAFLAAMIPAA
jgi:hypothetical protein